MYLHLSSKSRVQNRGKAARVKAKRKAKDRRRKNRMAGKALGRRYRQTKKG